MAMTNSLLQSLIQEAIDDEKVTAVIHMNNNKVIVLNYNVDKVPNRPKASDVTFKSEGDSDVFELTRIDANTNLPYKQTFLTEYAESVTIVPKGGKIDPQIIHW